MTMTMMIMTMPLSMEGRTNHRSAIVVSATHKPPSSSWEAPIDAPSFFHDDDNYDDDDDDDDHYDEDNEDDTDDDYDDTAEDDEDVVAENDKEEEEIRDGKRANTVEAAAAVVSTMDIFEAVQADDSDLITAILEADPTLLEALGPGGQTPLLHAVLTGQRQAVETLMALKANMFATEQDGYDVWHAAAFQGRAVILRLLLAEGRTLDHDHDAPDADAAAAAPFLDPINDVHKDGFYPIHRACWGREQRHTDTVAVFLLLKGGILKDLPAENGQTCYDMTPNPATQALLEQHGVVATVKDDAAPRSAVGVANGEL